MNVVRCCSYGSQEQQKAAAERLVAAPVVACAEQREAMAQRFERLAAQSDEASRYHSRPGGVAWQAEHTRWLAQFYRSEAAAIRAQEVSRE